MRKIDKSLEARMSTTRGISTRQKLSREIVQKGYGTVACGGGDGTLSGAINMIRTYVDEANAANGASSATW